MVLSVSVFYKFYYELNIIIFLFNIFQIIYNIYMKYLIDNEAPRMPCSRTQSPDNYSVSEVQIVYVGIVLQENVIINKTIN